MKGKANFLKGKCKICVIKFLKSLKNTNVTPQRVTKVIKTGLILHLTNRTIGPKLQLLKISLTTSTNTLPVQSFFLKSFCINNNTFQTIPVSL